jgi:hypothetical protein
LWTFKLSTTNNGKKVKTAWETGKGPLRQHQWGSPALLGIIAFYWGKIWLISRPRASQNPILGKLGQKIHLIFQNSLFTFAHLFRKNSIFRVVFRDFFVQKRRQYLKL